MGLDKELYHHNVPINKSYTGFNEVRIFRVSMIPYSQISNPHLASLSHNVGDVSHWRLSENMAHLLSFIFQWPFGGSLPCFQTEQVSCCW